MFEYSLSVFHPQINLLPIHLKIRAVWLRLSTLILDYIDVTRYPSGERTQLV